MLKKLILTVACFSFVLSTAVADDDVMMLGSETDSSDHGNSARLAQIDKATAEEDNTAMKKYIKEEGKKNKGYKLFRVSNFPNATKIPSELNPANLGKDIERLEFHHCPNVKVLEADLRMFSKLISIIFYKMGFESIKLDKNFKINNGGTYGQFTKLKAIRFKDCKNLTQLPTELSYMPSLEYIDVTGCDKLNEASIQILKTFLRKENARLDCDGVVREKLLEYLGK